MTMTMPATTASTAAGIAGQPARPAEGYSVIGHRLARDGVPVPFRQTPHGGARMKPSLLLIHYTAGLTAGSAISWFLDARSKASAHLVVARDGAATQLMAFDRTCWHAGKSQWKGVDGLNSRSIGIEIVNAGRLVRSGGGWKSWSGEAIANEQVLVARHPNEREAAGWHTYSAAQIGAVTAIGAALHRAYGFRDVLGHEDVSPGRKVDPGPAFPLASVADRILGRG
ncbi:N-acetylmuramoyl-L-alanine amidase [Phreatobacter sp.]|uniref:N-acetylmuramoyl-L-alanine amidase n=1 Tax=Phreatobacter sp. TaxID=1966341 RepID=UPI003F7021C1